ncbi:MAG: DNA-binding protein [Sulfuricurvum sp. PC08-66]|nr:MAG: DNA-binding protein [Sulfuricurvum sp. PC08-66]
MKKAEFVKEVAQKAGLSKKDTEAAIDAMVETMSNALASGDSVSFIGFGTFAVTQRAARKAKVPGTTRVVDVPATKAVRFKVGKQLKEAVAK